MAILLVGCYFIYDVYYNNEYLQFRMNRTLEGDSSGRDYFYSQMWNYWANSSSGLNYLFGFGFAASVKITGLYAHNDWLELLTMSGLFGVIIYIIFFVQLIKFSLKYSLTIQDKNIILSILLVWFLKTLFSMGYGDFGMNTILILLGYIVGKYNRANYAKNTISNT